MQQIFNLIINMIIRLTAELHFEHVEQPDSIQF
jgi:hypothetical protein